MFKNKEYEDINQQLQLLQQKVLHTRRFRSFFNKCFFEKSMNGEAFYVTTNMVKEALLKMNQRQQEQTRAKIKVYSQNNNGTFKRPT